jgi:hypothetical protein
VFALLARLGYDSVNGIRAMDDTLHRRTARSVIGKVVQPLRVVASVAARGICVIYSLFRNTDRSLDKMGHQLHSFWA